MKESVIVLIPVYNDLSSLETLVRNLEIVHMNEQEKEFSLLIVNDGSAGKIVASPSKLFKIHILHLHRNTGHQKAIAIGLAHIHHHMSCDSVMIMDADGEDRPDDTVTLLKTAASNKDSIVFARRKARQEGSRFRLFYVFYKILFRWLTGKKIAFGNFMVIPKQRVDTLVYYSEIWSHLSAAILKSRLPFIAVPVDRGETIPGIVEHEFYVADITWTWSNRGIS